MEAIEEFQRSLGAPVVAFAQEYWMLLLVAGVLVIWWIFGIGSRSTSVDEVFSDGESDGGGDGGD